MPARLYQDNLLSQAGCLHCRAREHGCLEVIAKSRGVAVFPPRLGIELENQRNQEGENQEGEEKGQKVSQAQEYLRGVLDQNLSYVQLKKMARTSLEHAFISGASLWSDARNFTAVKECMFDLSRPQMRSERCQNFLKKNEKANLQWMLESQLLTFESQPRPLAEASPHTPRQ
jgi:hypothetical protein